MKRKYFRTKYYKRFYATAAGILIGCLLLCLGGCRGKDAEKKLATENSAMTQDASSNNDVIEWSVPEREALS